MSNTLLRTLPRSGAASRNITKSAAGARGYASKEETPKPNLGPNRAGAALPQAEKSAFRAQLYESTAERTKKERADRERHARERQEWTGGRNLATTFGSLPRNEAVNDESYKPGTNWLTSRRTINGSC